MDEFDFDFVWTDYYFQPACRACEQWMPNGTNKCAWCQLSGVAWQWEATGFCLFCGCKRCDKKGLTGAGVEMEVWRMRGWMTGSLNGGEGEKAWCCEEGDVFIFTFLYLRWHEKEMHVREMVRERKENEIQRWSKCYLHVFPHLWACSLHVFCVSPPWQHGQANNQALLQPQHLCVGQTVSGAAQVADVPSHERGSRNARQEAQCAWERQLCKLRRDVWQDLTPPHPPSAPLLPLLHLFLLLFLSFSFPSPPPLSSSSPRPSFFLIVFALASACWFYLLDWHEKNTTF